MLEEGVRAGGQRTCWRTVYMLEECVRTEESVHPGGQCTCWRRVYVLEDSVHARGVCTC